jgi:hypothetical protein
MSAPKDTPTEAPTKEVEEEEEERTEVSSTDSRAVEEEPAEFVAPGLGTHADPNGGAPIAHGDESEDAPEAFGLAGATPEETQENMDEAGVVGGNASEEAIAEAEASGSALKTEEPPKAKAKE